MAKFSDRIGITKPPAEIQVGEMSDQLRNSLWNLLVMIIEDQWATALKELYIHYFKEPVDYLPKYDFQCRDWLREIFMSSEWYDVYNLIEHCLQNVELLTEYKVKQPTFEKYLNFFLERELSGYRAIKGELVPITDENEIQHIRDAISVSSKFGFDGVSQHFNNALRLLGKKPEPEYPNSIKESISAVEGVCKILTGEKSGGIDKALTKLAGKIQLHPALKAGLSNLYGYSSDEDGIRHPILESSDIGFAEAKYMLVSCSAFVNYLIEKSHQAGIL